MSGLFLLGLIALWLFVGWLIYLLWRSLAPKDKGKLLGKVIHAVIGLALFSAWFGAGFWVTAGKKEYYDAQVREMCAKDGGIRVYETVSLPLEKFNEWGQINFFKPTKDKDALGREYIYESDTDYIKRGKNFEISIMRHHAMVYRRADKKLLGEQISYGRRGGDLPGFWHPSSYSCPEFNGDSVLKKIFVKMEQKGDKE